jgi:uncharacterized protein YbjT (DUF2867 family)
MNRILILGAQSPLAQSVIAQFRDVTTASLSVLTTRSNRFPHLASERVNLIEGSAFDERSLVRTMRGHDVVIAHPEGAVETHAERVVRAMNRAGVRRIIYISWTGIYSELAAGHYATSMTPHHLATEAIENSDLLYTVLRPAWPTDDNEIDYVTRPKGEPFNTREVSRKSISALIVQLSIADKMEVRSNLSVSRSARPLP